MSNGEREREARVLEAVRERREQVNAAVEQDLPPAEPERLYAASRHLIEAGGKRLRPALVLLVAEALGGESDDYYAFPGLDGDEVDVMTAAVGVELIHTFTLAHDDIMDEDDMRRG